MLTTLREKTSGWIASAILIALTIPFAFFGINNYFDTQAESWVAKVGDVEIGQEEFRQRFEEYRQRMRQMMGESYDAQMVETVETKRRLLDQMINEELLRQTGSTLGVLVSDATLQKEIADMAAFQTDGKFDPARYRLLLEGQRMTPRSFEQRMRQSLEVNAIPGALSASAFASSADVDRFLQLRDQQRDFIYAVLDAPAADTLQAPTDEELKAHYDANADRYVTEEQVRIEYVEIEAAKLEVPTTVDEATLKQKYEEQQTRFGTPEQRLASHILVKVAPDADAAAQQAAQKKTQELVEKARAEGADFAALAKENSDDPGSRATGGDLGWLEKGITDPAFEAALFALEAGKISDPVKSADGWHVIQLREVRPSSVKPFEEVRGELEAEELQSARETLYNDKISDVIDAVYKDPSTLQTAADQVGVEVKEAGPFGRGGGADPITARPEVINAAFSDSVLADGNASDAIDLGPSHTLVLRVIEHLTPTPIAFDDVRDQIRQELINERRAAKAKEIAEKHFAALKSGSTLEAVAKEAGIEVKVADGTGRASATIEPPLITEAFKLGHPAEGKVLPGMVALGGDRYALLELRAVRDGDASKADAAAKTAAAEQLKQAIAGTEMEEFVQALRKQIPVKTAEERL